MQRAPKIKQQRLCLSALLVVPLASADAFARTSDEKYAAEEIFDAFYVMEQCVVYGDNRNISFDLVSAVRSKEVTKNDLGIALDYAELGNAPMNAKAEFNGSKPETRAKQKIGEKYRT